MKRTKSMIFIDSAEATELYLCAVNNGDCYHRIKAVYTNLKKKWSKGQYDNDRAVEAWYYIATEEAKIYFKDFGYKFTVTEKWSAAVKLEEHYREYLINGDENV